MADFSKRVVNYSQSLKPMALCLTRDTEDAKDLLQETVVRALAASDKFMEGTNLKAWLYTIMKNIFINEYRRKAKRKTLLDTTDDLFFLNSASMPAINRGETLLHLTDIDQCLQKLSNDFKIPFLMHFKGFKYHEIAEELSLPIGTVKSRIHFARKELQKSLKFYRN